MSPISSLKNHVVKLFDTTMMIDNFVYSFLRYISLKVRQRLTDQEMELQNTKCSRRATGNRERMS